MSIYSLMFEYAVHGELCQNRFHYATPASGATSLGAEKLVEAFQQDVLISLAALMTNVGGAVTYNRLYAVNLYDDTDFSEDTGLVPLVPTGTFGEAVPSFLSLSFTSPRFRVGKNRWYKRLAGLGETAITGNLYTATVQAGAAADAMTAQITQLPSGQKYNPVLLFLDPSSVPPYQVYVSEAAQRVEMALVTTWAYYNLTTQRSRKEGVGI